MLNVKTKNFNKNLFLLLMGRTVSDMGTGIQMVVMPLYIIDIGGSAATVGLFSFLSLIPVLLVYPFSGVLGDRINRKSIMVVTDFLSGIVIIALAFAAYSKHMNMTLLLVVQVLVALLNGLFDPATKGMLPQLVEQQELTRANSMLASLRTLAALLGPVIGTVLYARPGIAALFLVNGISFLLSGASELMIEYKHIRRELTAEAKGIVEDLSDGLRLIWSKKTIRKLCTFFLVLYALVQPIFQVVLPLFFRTQLNYTDTQYGYLQMIIILGALSGSILVGLLFAGEKKVYSSLLIGCSLLIGAMLAFMLLLFPGSIRVLENGSLLYFALLACVLAMLSIAIMFIHVPVQTFIQQETPNDYMSRMFSIVGMITKGGMPFGALIYGIVLNRVQVHWTILAANLLLLLITILFLKSIIRAS